MKLVVIREHEWEKMCKSEQVVNDLPKQFNPREPLAPFQALYGERTTVVWLRFTAGSEYIDVTFLYPYINCNCTYPLGQPIFLYIDFDSSENYFGLITAIIYPPCVLYFPVLYKTTLSKLVFTECHTCAKTNFRECVFRHDEARALTGVWVTPELDKGGHGL